MFILKRQDVEISMIQHPKKDQQVPVLHYQGQTFRLLNVFSAAQEEDAKSLWRDLTDNRGKACVLLEEPDRYSVWGKVRLDQLAQEADHPAGAVNEAPTLFIQASLLLLQAVYFDIEDLLGARQLSLFQKEIAAVLMQGRFPKVDSPAAVQHLLTADPLVTPQIPPWQEHHLDVLLQELYRLGREHFGNSSFASRVLEALQDLPVGDRNQFLAWMKRSPAGKLWKVV